MRPCNFFKILIPILAMLAFVFPASAEKRIALVIGNSAYETIGALKNAGNDAELLAKSLKEMDFDVTLGLDLNEDDMGDAIDVFAAKSRTADVAAVYYAGHGMQKDGENYLMPIDTVLKSEASIARDGISLKSILDILIEVPTGLVFLDACRNNPFAEKILAQAKSQKRSAGISRGLAFVRPTGDTLITFATLPNTTASDGTGKNSPFAQSLARHMKTPNTEVSVLMKRVTRDVLKATNGEQRPQQLSQMQNEFYFATTAVEEDNKDDKAPIKPTVQIVAAKPVSPRALLTVYPPRVTIGDEVSVVADVPASCKPFFLNIAPSNRLTPIPLQYFKNIDIQNGQFRYEISPGSRYGLVVQENDEKGTNQLGYFCEPQGQFEKPQLKATLKQILSEIKSGREEGNIELDGKKIAYQMRQFTVK